MSWKRSTGSWANPSSDPGARAATADYHHHYQANPNRSPVPGFGAAAGMPATPPSREASPQRSARLGPQSDPLGGSMRFTSRLPTHGTLTDPVDSRGSHSANGGDRASGAMNNKASFLPPGMRGVQHQHHQANGESPDGLMETPRDFGGTGRVSGINSPAALRDFRGEIPQQGSSGYQYGQQQPIPERTYDHQNTMPGLMRPSGGFPQDISHSMNSSSVNNPAQNWVTITDVDLLCVWQLLHFLSLEFGPVERHQVPLRTGSIPTWIYVQFADPIHAAQAVSRRQVYISSVRMQVGIVWCQDAETCQIPSLGPQATDAVLFSRACVSKGNAASGKRGRRHVSEVNVCVERWYHYVWEQLRHPFNLALVIVVLGWILLKMFF